MRLFIEVVGFVGDYPEASKVFDVLSHSGRAPCTVCTFRHRAAASLVRFAYALNIHSHNTVFCRIFRKTLSLRSAGISLDDCTFLGMAEGSADAMNEAGRWPLLKLASELDKVRQLVPITNEGRPVVSVFFDPYSRNMVAPDHLLAGICKLFLEDIFVTLSTSAMCMRLDILL